jgi:hypothetical protein
MTPVIPPQEFWQGVEQFNQQEFLRLSRHPRSVMDGSLGAAKSGFIKGFYKLLLPAIIWAI